MSDITVWRVLTPQRLVTGFVVFAAAMTVLFAVSLSRGSSSSVWFFVTVAVVAVVVLVLAALSARAHRGS